MSPFAFMAVAPLSPTDIRALRRMVGQTQTEFAQRFGVSTGAVAHWERRGLASGPSLVALRELEAQLDARKRERPRINRNGAVLTGIPAEEYKAMQTMPGIVHRLYNPIAPWALTSENILALQQLLGEDADAFGRRFGVRASTVLKWTGGDHAMPWRGPIGLALREMLIYCFGPPELSAPVARRRGLPPIETFRQGSGAISGTPHAPDLDPA